MKKLLRLFVLQLIVNWCDHHFIISKWLKNIELKVKFYKYWTKLIRTLSLYLYFACKLTISCHSNRFINVDGFFHFPHHNFKIRYISWMSFTSICTSFALISECKVCGSYISQNEWENARSCTSCQNFYQRSTEKMNR